MDQTLLRYDRDQSDSSPRIRGALSGEGLGYRPALDGLRGVSILAVMAFHSGLLRGGYLGVDMFFTLSGFLITTLLLDEHARFGTIDLNAFYIRRALRLLPAFSAMVAVFGLATILTIPEPQRLSASLFIVAVVFYVGNWATILGYNQGLIGHTWSLSIEEQFYVIWPPVLKRVLRFTTLPTLTRVLFGAAAVCVIYRLALVAFGVRGRYLYVGTDTHADPIVIGCAAACWLSCRAAQSGDSKFAMGPALIWRLIGGAGLAAIVVLLAATDLTHYFKYFVSTSCVAIATALIIIDTMRPDSWLAVILGVRPLVSIGKRSYALYLWHYPIFLLGNALWSPRLEFQPINIIPCWTASFIIAEISFRLIEQPALQLKSKITPRGITNSPA